MSDREGLCLICAAPLERPQREPWTGRPGGKIPEPPLPSICSETGSRLSNGLCRRVWTAINQVAPAERTNRTARPEYAACPNCAADLEAISENQRFLQCSKCRLRLHVLAHDDLVEFGALHAEMEKRWE